MAETLREKLNRIDLRCIDEDLKFYDLRSLFEATAPRLSPEDKEEIKKVIQNTDDAETIAAVLQAKAMDKNESLEEDTDSLQSRIFDFLDELGGYADYNQRIEEVSDEFGMSPDEAEGYVWDWTLNSEAEWHDTADQEEDESLQEKLVDAPQEVIDKLLEILKKYGFVLDDSVGHENPIKSAIFGDVHIQVINPDSHIDDDEISFDRQMETYVSRNMIDEISRLDDEYNCPITWNFGPNNKGQVTGGLDIMKQYIPDEADECLREKLDLSDYEELSYPLRDGGKNYQLFRKLENGKGKWAAAPMEMGDVKYDDAFEITYDQARGFEPINTIGKLSRDLGKKLLPKRESLKESSELTDEDWEDFYKLEEEIANVMHGIDSDLDDAQANIYHDDSDGTRRLTFRFVCGVNKISDRTRKQIINALENYLNKTKFNQFIYIRLYPIDVPVGASYEVIIDAETEPDENLTEASYGGAYDIKDDMYFTKEELMEFGYDLAEQFSAWAESECKLSDLYMTSPVDLVMEVAESDGVEHQAKVKIDMRKIRLPRDIEKYTDIILKQWKDSYNEYHSYDESLNEDYIKDIVKAVKDFTQNYAAEQGQFNPNRFDPDYINDLMDEFRANGYSVGYSVKDPSKDDTDLENQVYWFEKEFNKEEVDKLRNRLLELNKAIENGEDPESVAWEKANILDRLDEIGVNYYTESVDDNTPYTYEQMERELKSATNEWTKDNFEGWVSYKDEFDSAMQILSHHYENVDNLGHTHRGYGFFATRPSLFEDTVKQNGKWVNKGKEGTHGKFATKKAADAQRRAMFANGYKESLNKDNVTLIQSDKLGIIVYEILRTLDWPGTMSKISVYAANIIYDINNDTVKRCEIPIAFGSSATMWGEVKIKENDISFNLRYASNATKDSKYHDSMLKLEEEANKVLNIHKSELINLLNEEIKDYNGTYQNPNSYSSKLLDKRKFRKNKSLEEKFLTKRDLQAARLILKTSINPKEIAAAQNLIKEYNKQQEEIKNESLSDEKEYRAFLGKNKNANKKFDYKKYGKYFDKDGKIIPELEDEFFSIIKTADLSEAYVDADKNILDIIRSDKEYNANYHVKTHTPDFSAIPDGTVITLKSLNKYHPEVQATIEKISDNNWKYVYSYGDDSWDRYLDNYGVMREIKDVDNGAYESLNEAYSIGYVKCNPYNADLIYSVSIEGPYENRDGEKYNLVNLYLICGKDYVDAESYDGIAWVDAKQWVDDIQFEQLVWYPESESLNDVFEENEYEPCNKPNAIWHYNEEKDKWYRDKNFYEDYQHDKDEWGDPYSYDEVERELKNITNDWTDEEGTIRCYWEQEKEYGMQILKKHYDIVEPSDGRTGPGEHMSWVIAYSKPKEELEEAWTRNDYLNLEHGGYVDIDRVADYIWAKYEGDIDDKRDCAKSIMNTKIYQQEGKVGIDVINEFSGAHNLVEREDFDESLNESVTSNLQDKIIDCLDYFIEMEMEFPKDKFLADSWEDVKDGIQVGIDPEFEVAEGVVEYLKPIITFNKKYNKEVGEEGVFQDEIEMYQSLVKAMNNYLAKNGYEDRIEEDFSFEDNVDQMKDLIDQNTKLFNTVIDDVEAPVEKDKKRFRFFRRGNK